METRWNSAEQETHTAGPQRRRPGEHALPRIATRGDAYDTGQTQPSRADGMASLLGWFSIGLGMAQVVAPDFMHRLVGVNEGSRDNAVMRTMGMREVGHGIAILATPQPAKAVWSRVGGDVLDLVMLGRLLADRRNDRTRVLGATLSVLGIAALDYYTARQLDRVGQQAAAVTREPGILTKRSVTVNRPVEEVYAFWRNLENLPRFMRHLESVRVLDGRRSHWVAKAPAGKTVEWDAEIVNERENELLSWRATEDADVHNEGTVRFSQAPGGRGTEVRIALRYEPPGGVLGSKLAMLWREEPGQQVQDDLRRFKQVMELGEVVVSDATYERGPHPAQPPAEV